MLSIRSRRTSDVAFSIGSLVLRISSGLCCLVNLCRRGCRLDKRRRAPLQHCQLDPRYSSRFINSLKACNLCLLCRHVRHAGYSRNRLPCNVGLACWRLAAGVNQSYFAPLCRFCLLKVYCNSSTCTSQGHVSNMSAECRLHVWK